MTEQYEACAFLPDKAEREPLTGKTPLEIVLERIRLMRICLPGIEDHITVSYEPECEATMLIAHKEVTA